MSKASVHQISLIADDGFPLHQAFQSSIGKPLVDYLSAYVGRGSYHFLGSRTLRRDGHAD